MFYWEDVGIDGRVIIEYKGMGRCGLDSSGSELGIVMRSVNRMVNININNNINLSL